MAIKSWCLISAVIFLQISTSTWVFADDAGLNSTDTGSFNDSTTSLGGPLNDSNSNLDQSSILAAIDQFNLNQFNMNKQPADQPQQDQHESGIPTRPPTDPNRASTFPPLVHNEGASNGTDKQKTDAQTTQKPAGAENSKSDNSKGGSGYFYGNFVVVLCGACVLHLLY
ncbi:hypothetical protein ILUMI_23223 [Ignelater luminosus]|uniref:Uncharacterized protein n=1 Tax=Ignelater luminosus TaxID=2038154 RepID=A0A8K0CF17_IGNLU|nr:hypothetical protein ILUMI_23223 [Ignelater luminosus]